MATQVDVVKAIRGKELLVAVNVDDLINAFEEEAVANDRNITVTNKDEFLKEIGKRLDAQIFLENVISAAFDAADSGSANVTEVEEE